MAGPRQLTPFGDRGLWLFSVHPCAVFNQDSWAQDVCLVGWFLSKRAYQLQELI